MPPKQTIFQPRVEGGAYLNDPVSEIPVIWLVSQESVATTDDQGKVHYDPTENLYESRTFISLHKEDILLTQVKPSEQYIKYLTEIFGFQPNYIYVPPLKKEDFAVNWDTIAPEQRQIYENNIKGVPLDVLINPDENLPLTTQRQEQLCAVYDAIDQWKKQHPYAHVVPFLQTKAMDIAAAQIGAGSETLKIFGSSHASETVGRKEGFHAMAAEIGIPVPKSVVFNADTPITQHDTEKIAELFELSGNQIIAKTSTSVGGGHTTIKFDPEGKEDTSVTFVVTSIEEAVEKLAALHHEHKEPLVIEEYYTEKDTLSAGLTITPDGFHIQYIWQQLLEDNTYIGGTHATEAQIQSFLPTLEKIAQYHLDHHYYGYFNIDALFLTDVQSAQLPPEERLRAIEENSRMAATGNPLRAAETICGYIPSGFLCTHVSVPQGMTIEKALDILKDNGILFDKTQRDAAQADQNFAGIMPFNFGLALREKHPTLDLLFLSNDAAAIKPLLEKAHKLLSQKHDQWTE